MNYVCGFVFASDLSKVLLRLKARPAWQRGKLNGIGGKVESGETPLYAMRREAREEAGLEDAALANPGWSLFRTERFRGDAPDGNADVAVHFFAARLHTHHPLLEDNRPDGGEVNTPVYYSTVPILAREGRLLYNLEYLVPYAKVWLESGAHRRALP